MSDFLKTMAARSRERAAAAGAFYSSDFDQPVVPLSLSRFDVIAEIKETSPAEGALASATHDRRKQASRYASGGAAAISVLTEPSRFDGALSHLQDVVVAVPGTPVMRKDFLVSTTQIQEARKAGASGVLLIATMLPGKALDEMLDCAFDHNLFVLLESFDEEDLKRSSGLLENAAYSDRAVAGQLLFGVNTRNLRTLAVDPERLAKLAPLLPQGKTVAESGLLSADDAARVASLGYELALVGSALMRSDDPQRLVASMKAAGVAARAAA